MAGIGDHRALPICQPSPTGELWTFSSGMLVNTVSALSETKLLSSSIISWLWFCVFFEGTKKTKELKNLSHEVNRKRRGRTQMVYRGKQGGKPRVLFLVRDGGASMNIICRNACISAVVSSFVIQFIGVILVHMIIWQWFPALFSQRLFLFAFLDTPFIFL